MTNYVNSFNLFGIEARQNPCLTGNGTPTTSTSGAIGELYMDTDTGKIYKCVSVKDGSYIWESTIRESEDTNIDSTIPEANWQYGSVILTTGSVGTAGNVRRDVDGYWHYSSISSNSTPQYYKNVKISLLTDNVAVRLCKYENESNSSFVSNTTWGSKGTAVFSTEYIEEYVIGEGYYIIVVNDTTLSPTTGVPQYSVEDVLQRISITGCEPISELANKKWLFIGDSITEHNFRATKNYDQYLQDMLGIIPLNYGKSGTGVTYPFQGNPSWLDALSTLPTDVDVISVMGGLNDRHTPLGQWGDRGTDTVYGGVWNYFNNLITKYPNKPIIYITSTPREYSYGADGEFTGWIDAFIKTAHNFSIPVLDLYRNSGLRPWNATNNAEYFSCSTSPTGDGVHPNEKGQKLMAKKIYHFALQYLTE